ncbi:MAG: electron transport complex subunit RsxC [Sulfuricella sp.]|jgi:electron transport complex protein RnfC|nr:electron transport complex subunit RsxC [Sulfuricella sp.]
MRTLHPFHGGIHPPEHKSQSTRQGIAAAPLPARLVVPLRQHNGNPARPVVAVGDHVLKGQMIGAPEGFISAAVHAPASGRVMAIEMQPIPHPSGLPDVSVVLEPDGEERWIERQAIDYRAIDPADLRNRLRDAGVVGLGGAVFPSHIKLDASGLETLVINAAECEPYITCDDMLMRERAAEVVQGIAIMQHVMAAREVLIGIEDNKPEAISAMQAACQGSGFEVVTVPTLYPSGSAKQLIKLLTGKEVPSGALAPQVGVQCFNVATAYTIHRAVNHGEPVISRIVTLTGNMEEPRNYEVLIGTPVGELVKVAKPRADTSGYLMGGPMMGLPLTDPGVPVVKATNCIIATSAELFPPPPRAMPCIRCTRCAQACPADLQPQELFWFAKAKNFAKAQEYQLFDCIECGCCNYVCPSHIPLVQFYRFAKSEIHAQERDRKASERARERHEFREFRLEREKQEKAAKHAAKAAQAAASPDGGSGDEAAAKKAAIQAAIDRAKAKKAAVTPQNVDDLPPEAQAKIDEIEERRTHARESAGQAAAVQKSDEGQGAS